MIRASSEDGSLKRTHIYFTQVQLQMYIFVFSPVTVVYTNKECRLMPFLMIKNFVSSLLKYVKIFFFTFILPELVTRKLEKISQLINNTSETIGMSQRKVDLSGVLRNVIQ